MRKLAVVKQTSQKQLLPQRNNTDGRTSLRQWKAQMQSASPLEDVFMTKKLLTILSQE